MEQMDKTWVIASKHSMALELVAGARNLGEQVTLVWTGGTDCTVGADRVYSLSKADSYLDYIPMIKDLVEPEKPGLVMVELSRNGRLLAAHLAALCQTSVLTDVTELWVEEKAIFSRRMVYGGTAYKTERVGGKTAVAVVGPGIFEASPEQAPGEVIPVAAGVMKGIRFVERRARAVLSVNLSAAKKVVSVGRGLGSAEKLPLAQELAEAIDAELACSRPVAEEEGWLPRERYVGVSGSMIKPEVYIAIGISGQVQHMVGIAQANMIVAINRDKAAPIFKNCDYGIVGDMEKVIPALIRGLKER